MDKLFRQLKTSPLAAMCGGSALIYLAIFTLRFPLFRTYNIIPPVDYTKLTGYSSFGLILYVIGLALLFWLYILAIQQTIQRREKVTPRFVFSSSALLALISIFSYPLTAIDLFIYAIRTRGWALYNLNPLATAPELLPNADPWLGLAAEWVDAPSPYGPIWEILSLGAFFVSGDSFLTHLLILKALMALTYLGCAWLIYLILQDIQPNWATVGAITFAWNPLVLMESVQNAHNDILMMFFLLVGGWLFVRWHKSQSNSILFLFGLTFALSILVKFVTILILPFFLLGIATLQPTWLRRVAIPTIVGLFIGAIVVLAMIPLWPGWENWAVLTAGRQAGRSLLALLVLGLRDSLGTNAAFDFARNLILGTFGLIYLYFLARPLLKFFRRTANGVFDNLTFSEIITPAFYVLFWYVLLAAPVFHAWYLLWFFPLATLVLPKQNLLLPAIVFSVTALLIIPYFETIRVWYPYLLRNHFLGHLIGVPLLILPVAIAVRWAIVRPNPISGPSHSEV